MTKRVAVVFLFSVIALQCACAHPGPGIVVDARGQIFFVNGYRSRIIKLDAAGKTTVFAERQDGRNLSHIHHLIIDKRSNLYTVSDEADDVYRISPNGVVTSIYTPKPGKDNPGIGLNGFPFTIDGAGNIYFVPGEPGTDARIFKMSPDGKVAPFVGGRRGHADGKGGQARFGFLYQGCFAWGPRGELYLTDSSSVRKITADGTVTTLAGAAESGYTDGKGEKARFNGAFGIACDARGNLFVAELENRRIRMIKPNGTVTTIAGSGKSGFDDGVGQNATFQMPVGIAVVRNGSLFVLDYGYGDSDPVRVRRISTRREVSTLAVVRNDI